MICINTRFVQNITWNIWGLAKVIPDHVHASEELLATSISNGQGILNVRFACTLSTTTYTTIENIMVHMFVNNTFHGVAFEYYGITNYIFCTYSDRFTKGLLWPPKTRVFCRLFCTCCIRSIHQANGKFKATFDVLILSCTVCFPFFHSCWLYKLMET